MNTLSYKTVSANKATADKQWIVVDADGHNLGRMASKIAMILRGKYKASYISNEAYHGLKVLNRLKKSLDDKIKTIKREISTVVATVNPEIEKVFPNHANNVNKALEILSDKELGTLYDLLDKVYKANWYFFALLILISNIL